MNARSLPVSQSSTAIDRKAVDHPLVRTVFRRWPEHIPTDRPPPGRLWPTAGRPRSSRDCRGRAARGRRSSRRDRFIHSARPGWSCSRTPMMVKALVLRVRKKLLVMLRRAKPPSEGNSVISEICCRASESGQIRDRWWAELGDNGPRRDNPISRGGPSRPLRNRPRPRKVANTWISTGNYYEPAHMR